MQIRLINLKSTSERKRVRKRKRHAKFAPKKQTTQPILLREKKQATHMRWKKVSVEESPPNMDTRQTQWPYTKCFFVSELIN